MLAPTQRIGDILVDHGAISRPAMEAYANNARGALGTYLRSYDVINGRALARALADQHDLHYMDLERNPADPALFSPRDLDHYIAHRYVPYARDKSSLTIATPEPSAALRAEAMRHHDCHVKLIVTSPRDLAHYFATAASVTSTRRARLDLRRSYRDLVADRILLPHQSHGMIALSASLLLAFVVSPATSWQIMLVVCNLFYLATLAIKIQLYMQGSAAVREQQRDALNLKREVAALNAADLPIYTILVPMYQESAAVMERLIANLGALDYPREKLDIKLICEADDAHTITALKTLHPPETMEIVRVPPSNPRTKPKACNVALQHVRGEFLVIYDAEDAPATDQLKRAIARFNRGNEKLACLQAPLNYYNRDENLLTELFSIEYSALFRLLLPALERMKLPIPLGGTSNHLRVAALRAAGGWDAFNVTEDADLGIRLAYLGYETQILPSLTLEEAPIGLGAWMKQRTRWIKGYIQTWLVYTRDPKELKKRLGTHGYYGFQFFVGAPALTFLLAPLFWGIFILSLTGAFSTHLSPLMLSFCLISFFGGVISHWVFARKVIELEGWYHLRLALVAYPLYWLLHSIAAARAFWQLLTAPHYWEKTRHGVSDMLEAARNASMEAFFVVDTQGEDR